MKKKSNEDLPLKEYSILWVTSKLKRYKLLEVFTIIIYSIFLAPVLLIGAICWIVGQFVCFILEPTNNVRRKIVRFIVLKLNWNELALRRHKEENK